MSAPAAAPTIRELRADEAAACEAILRALPAWFGIEEAIVSYRRAIEEMETLVAEVDGAVVGFVTLAVPFPEAADIHVMGVRAEHHGGGVGTALVRHAEERLAARGVEFLQVKTLGPSRECAAYDRTRGFYRRCGFVPLEEHGLWGDANPCLVMVKHLACTRGASSR